MTGGWGGGSPVCARVPPPPSHRDRTPFSFFALMPPERGLFESQRVSVSVSKRWNGGFCAAVSASKISVHDSGVRARFDDCVGGWQFGPFRLHHPVIGIELRSNFWHKCRQNRGLLNLGASLRRSLRGEKVVFALPSLHRKFPFLAPSSETSSM